MSASSPLSNSSQPLLQGPTVAVGGSYQGCLDQLIVNEHQVSLFDPLEMDTEITTCGPRPPAQAGREFESGVWLFGSGSYVRLAQQLELASQFQIEFEVRTLDASGLLLYYPGTDSVQYLALYLSEGRIRAEYRLSTLDRIAVQSELVYNTGLWYSVVLLVDGANVTLEINNTETLAGSSSTIMLPDATFSLSQVLFVGGLSAEYSAAGDTLATSSSVSGCVRNLQIDTIPVDLQDGESVRADFRGCPGRVEPGVRFMGNGRAEFGISRQDFHNVSFGFRTTQLAALLLQVGDLSLSIFHSKLRVDVAGRFVLTSEESGLNDNARHTVSLLYSSTGNQSM